MNPVERPGDLVAVGRISDAWGIRGGIKVVPFSAQAEALLSVKQWWLEREGQWRDVEVLSAKVHSSVIAANLMGWADRQAAEALKGSTVWIARSRFPALSDDEYYWVDLIGLDVVDASLAPLGVVRAMLENGAHSIIEIERERAGKVVTELIPFVERHVKSVDLAARLIVVDWQIDE